MMLDPRTAARLKKAHSVTYPDGMPNSMLASELSYMYDVCMEQYQCHGSNEVYFTRSQWCRLRDFYNVIHHTFYNYTLSVK